MLINGVPQGSVLDPLPFHDVHNLSKLERHIAFPAGMVCLLFQPDDPNAQLPSLHALQTTWPGYRISWSHSTVYL